MNAGTLPIPEEKVSPKYVVIFADLTDDVQPSTESVFLDMQKADTNKTDREYPNSTFWVKLDESNYLKRVDGQRVYDYEKLANDCAKKYLETIKLDVRNYAGVHIIHDLVDDRGRPLEFENKSIKYFVDAKKTRRIYEQARSIPTYFINYQTFTPKP